MYETSGDVWAYLWLGDVALFIQYYNVIPLKYVNGMPKYMC